MEQIAKLIRARRSVRTFDGQALRAEDTAHLTEFTRRIENPYEIPAERIRELKVERTILAGKPYAKQKGGFVPTILKGIAGNGNF